jgi:quinol monooxygenase YgiN
MSHTALVEFPCNPGKGKELVEMLSGALVDTRAFEGCELVEVYTDNDNPDLVILWEKWGSRENYDAYLAWRIETGLMDALAAFMDTTTLQIHNLDPQDA